MTDWDKLKLRTALYSIKCCPSCGHKELYAYATGPTWSCQKCGVKFTVTNPSYLKRKEQCHSKQNQPVTVNVQQASTKD